MAALHLTENELRCVKAMADGLSYEEAGQQLHVAAATVKTHLQRSRDRWSARNTTHLVALAFRAGLLDLAP